MKRRVVGEYWFTQSVIPFCFGIVVTECEESKERTAYIGSGDGIDPTDDVKKIVREHGGKIDSKALRELADLLDGKISQMTCCGQVVLDKTEVGEASD